MQKEWAKAISMLVAIKTEDGLRRGAVMSIMIRFGMAHCTIYHLWDRAESAHGLGVSNSPEFIS